MADAATETPGSRAGSHGAPYALWDTLKDLRFRWGWFFAATPTAARSERARQRVGMYAEAARNGVFDFRLAEDLARRRRMWERHLDDGSTEPDAEGYRKRRRHEWAGPLGEFLFIGGDEVFVALIAGAIAVVAGTALGVLLAIPWLAWHIARTRRRARCRKALAARVCPDCSYDLSGLPDEIEPENLEGQRIGPERCPECGVPWPLLPPPVR